MPKGTKKIVGKADYRNRLALRARKFEEIFHEICALQGYDPNLSLSELNELLREEATELKAG